MFLTIDDLSKKLNVSKGTLRRWEKEGKIKSERTAGGHRRYYDTTFESESDKLVIAYARVSTQSQKEDFVV
jgi:putative resolvase